MSIISKWFKKLFNPETKKAIPEKQIEVSPSHLVDLVTDSVYIPIHARTNSPKEKVTPTPTLVFPKKKTIKPVRKYPQYSLYGKGSKTYATDKASND